MGVNIDEILSSLEQEKTAEANFADNIGSEAPAVSEDAPANPEEAPEVPVAETDEDLAKIAAECDAQGRVMARAFVAEINKVAAEEGEVAEEYYESSETSEPTYEEEYVDEDGTEVEETKEAEEYDPATAIIGTLYNDYFGGEE